MKSAAQMSTLIAAALAQGMSTSNVRQLPFVREYNSQSNEERCAANKIAKRRAKNKVARKSRRRNRMSA